MTQAEMLERPVPVANLACPDKARHPGDAVGCGSTHVVGPDDEGFFDCCNCGLFFKADAI